MSPIVISQSGTSAVLTWTSATTNGNGIIAYRVMILNRGTGTYSEYKPLCDGTDLSIIASLSCTIPISSFISNLNYLPGDLIKAEIQAQNAAGWSTLSSSNIDSVVAQSVPIASPTNIQGTSTTTSVTLTWT
jgi:hypothetical protein